MRMLFVNYNLDSYGKFKLYTHETNLLLEELLNYAEEGLGTQWSEYAILSFSSEGVPTVLDTLHKQAPLRKNHILNKRKKKCSSTPTPQNDHDQLLAQLFATQSSSPLNNWSTMLENSIVQSMNTNAGTQLSETSTEPVTIEQVTESF